MFCNFDHGFPLLFWCPLSFHTKCCILFCPTMFKFLKWYLNKIKNNTGTRNNYRGKSHNFQTKSDQEPPTHTVRNELCLEIKCKLMRSSLINRILYSVCQDYISTNQKTKTLKNVWVVTKHCICINGLHLCVI